MTKRRYIQSLVLIVEKWVRKGPDEMDPDGRIVFRTDTRRTLSSRYPSSDNESVYYIIHSLHVKV